MLKKNNKTLKHKIYATSIYILLFLALVMGTISVYVVGVISDNNSKIIMTELCESETQKIDNKLKLVRNSVEIIHEYFGELEQTGLDVYSELFESKMKEFTIAVANQTNGAMSVYFRYNPEITGRGIDGFFWSRESDEDTFKAEVPTDILAYGYKDVEHVGWFYTPKETGKALWMTPYYNQNLDVFMISYIIPIYRKTNEFVGVIGMDIDFKSIIDEAGGNKVYHSGKVIIAELKERLIYSTDDDGNVRTQKLVNRLYNHITTINGNEELLEMSEDSGEISLICCKRLSNGMMMYVNVPKKEINMSRNTLIICCIIISFIAWSIAVYIMESRMNSIVEPIEKLTEVANHYADGKWDVVYISDTEDEIQELSEKIAKMAENTQTYINEINSLARKDAMTGLRNKTAYIEQVEMIKANRHEAYNHYAVVVLDLNLLKKANDVYGHEVGDLLIKEAGSYICSVFQHSAAFRIGGDEFVAILCAEDYENREELLRRFENGMNYRVPDTEVNLSVSFGMAAYPEEAQEYDTLFAIADERMYQKKREMKMERRD